MTPLPVIPPDPEAYPPLSALNDLLFCERRCFLHRVEGVWVENHHTTGGTLDHRRVHQTKDADHAHVRTARGLWVVSHRLRVVGVCDLVEFRPDPAGGPDAPVPGRVQAGQAADVGQQRGPAVRPGGRPGRDARGVDPGRGAVLRQDPPPAGHRVRRPVEAADGRRRRPPPRPARDPGRPPRPARTRSAASVPSTGCACPTSSPTRPPTAGRPPPCSAPGEPDGRSTEHPVRGHPRGRPSAGTT